MYINIADITPWHSRGTECCFNCAECQYLTDIQLDENHEVIIRYELEENKQ